jgi:hypothetical protein
LNFDEFHKFAHVFETLTILDANSNATGTNLMQSNERNKMDISRFMTPYL